MLDTEDIRQRIEADFGNRSAMVRDLFDAAIRKADYINHPRIIRCIVYLSKGDIELLKKHIDHAIFDPRDVMFWAEYININKELDSRDVKRIRDFNKTFDKCESDITE